MLYTSTSLERTWSSLIPPRLQKSFLTSARRYTLIGILRNSPRPLLLAMISDGSQASLGGVESYVSSFFRLRMFCNFFAKTSSNGSLGMDWVTGFIPYGARWRTLRRGLHAYFHPAASKAYRPLEQRAVHRLLRNLLQSPENFSQHLRQ